MEVNILYLNDNEIKLLIKILYQFRIDWYYTLMENEALELKIIEDKLCQYKMSED